MTTQDDINSFTTANTAGDLLVLAAQTYKTDTNRIISVATIANLPDLNNNTIDPGTVLYVESLCIPVIAHCGCWAGLDNRQLRNDFNTKLGFSWGVNTGGRLGDNTIVNKSSPVSIVGVVNWCQVSGGLIHSLGLRTNGTLWAWGFNGVGQLGDNTIVDKSSPVSVVGGITNWCQVSAGGYHSLGLRTNGTLWAWGQDSSGQLGDSANGSKLSPVSVVGGFTDWCQISAGLIHTLGVRTNGTAWAWGSGTTGMLGDNTIVAKSSPVSVVGGFTDWCQVSASTRHSLGLRINGTLWSWGCNSVGQLGDNTIVSKSSPVSVVGGFTDWCQVRAGYVHNTGLRTNGTAWSWGYNGQGQLGDNTAVNKSSPVSVVGGFTDWCQVSAGGAFTLGIRTNGTAWSWGLNQQGTLGDNTLIIQSSPILIAGGFTDWSQVSGGACHAIGLRTV